MHNTCTNFGVSLQVLVTYQTPSAARLICSRFSCDLRMATNRMAPLEMKVELTVIEDLGINLYGTLPSVISELVANAWDADATTVGITLDEGDVREDTKIAVTDNGHGMSYDDIQEKYLRVGRKRRAEEPEKTRLGRKVMGRKGIGKLSVFGVATNAEIKTVTQDMLIIFQMNVDSMISEARKNCPYYPDTTCVNNSTSEKQGTTITLTGLKRKTRIDAQSIRRSIARHFSVIGDGFTVSVNGRDISPTDKLGKAALNDVWDIDEFVDADERKWRVYGWIGAAKDTLDEEDRGVTIMARGKMIQRPTMFEVKSGNKFYYSYITGQINAEFFDAETDLMSTNRQSVIWDTPQGMLLKEWGSAKLPKISAELAEKRRTKSEDALMSEPEFESWRRGLHRREKGKADRIVRILTSKEGMSDDRRKEIMRHVITVFEQNVFQDLLASLESEEDPATLLSVFEQWDVVEAREIARVVKGRLDIIKKLKEHIGKNSREVPTLHEYFKKWPWMLDPTWTKWRDETYYSEILREKFPEKRLKESNRRIDFLAIGTGDTIHVVELKRPKHVINKRDVIQLVEYVEFVRAKLGNDDETGYNDVAGYIVAGTISKSPAVKRLIADGKPSRRYVRTYADLLTAAQTLHDVFEEKLAEFRNGR